MVKRHLGDYTWEGIPVLPYKEDGNTFRSVTRQILHEGRDDLAAELRYFEVGPGGHSTLERHQHSHHVLIFRGSGKVLVGEEIWEIGFGDLVRIPPLTWHQFRAAADEPLGFLCLVACERDRPQRPTQEDLESFPKEVADFVRV
jgi:mannose-6-phosphate isomerase-like protein (cupin superfamily)